MTFNIAPRESLTRCDYSNKFRTYPEEARLKEARRLSANLDVQETDSARLERQLMQRFSKGLFVQQGVNTHFIIKVGKCIFTAIITPPYFVLYLVPAWIFQCALPSIVQFCQAGFDRFSTRAQSVSRGLLQVSGLWLERFNKLFQFHLQFLQTIGKSSKDLIKNGFEEFKKSLLRLTAPFARLIQRIKDEAKKQRRKFEAWKDLFKEKIKRTLRFLTPSVSFRLPKLPKLPRFPLSLRLPKIAWADLMHQVWHSLPRWQILKALKSIALGLGGFVGDIIELNYQKWIEPYIRWILPSFRWGRAKTQQLLQSLSLKVAKIKRFLNSLKGQVLSYPARVKKAGQTSMQRLQIAVQRSLNILSRPGRLAIALQDFIRGKAGEFQKYLSSRSKTFQKTAFAFWRILKNTPQKIYEGMIPLSQLLFAFFLEVFKAFRLTYLLIKVLIRLSYQQLKQELL